MAINIEKGIIWNTVAGTLAVLSLLIVVGCAVLALFAPKTYADGLYFVGLRNVSMGVYDYSYEKSKDINDAYYLINRAIECNNSTYIVKTYKKLVEHKDYNNFLIYIEEKNINSSVTEMQKVALSNEDNYLKGKYIMALIKVNGLNEAFTFAYNDLITNNVTNYTDRMSYVMGSFIHYATKTKTENNVNSYVDNISVQTNIWDYYNKIKNIYTGIKNDASIEKFSKMKIVSRMIDILYSLQTICDLELTNNIFDLETIKTEYQKYCQEYYNYLKEA